MRAHSTDAPVALFDMDGTLFDFDGAMVRDLERLRAPGEPPASDTYQRDLPHLEARRRLIKRQSGWWAALEPIELGLALFRLAGVVGYHRMVLSKAPDPNKSPSAWTEKAACCARHLPGTPVTLSDDKGLVHGRVLVDDWPPYVTAWLRNHPDGLVVCPAQPWNAGVFEGDRRVVRATEGSMAEVEARMREAFGG